MTGAAAAKAKRFRVVPLALATAAVCSAILGASLTGSLSAFTAQITNSANSAGAGTIVLQEQSSGGQPVTCTSSADSGMTSNASTCSTINKFGGSSTLVPGGSASSATVTIKNTGSAPVNAFTLTKGDAGCSGSPDGATSTSGSATSAQICAQYDLVITVGTGGTGSNTTVVYSGKVGSFTSYSFTGATIPSPSSGSTTTVGFAVSVPQAAGNEYQGKTVSLPLVWKFQS